MSTASNAMHAAAPTLCLLKKRPEHLKIDGLCVEIQLIAEITQPLQPLLDLALKNDFQKERSARPVCYREQGNDGSKPQAEPVPTGRSAEGQTWQPVF